MIFILFIFQIRDLQKEIRKLEEKNKILEENKNKGGGANAVVMEKLAFLQEHKFSKDEENRINDAMRTLDPKRGVGLAAIYFLLVNI